LSFLLLRYNCVDRAGGVVGLNFMTKHEVKEYIKENLKIEIMTDSEDHYGDGNKVKVRVQLWLEGVKISESDDSCHTG
jgi:hypothetical protein